MTSKTLLLLILRLSIPLACESQSRIDLEALTFKEDIDSLMAGIQAWTEETAVVGTLPCVYTYEGKHFKFGPINFKDKAGEKYCIINLLFTRTERKKVASLIISMTETWQGLSMYHYLKNKFGPPKTLLDIPTFDNDGFQLDFSSYLWSTANDRQILLSHMYEYSENKKIITSYLYVIDNRVKDDDGGLLIERIISICGG